MRSEQEMLGLLLSFAKKDQRIRLVGMEGSRTNNKAPKDEFQDYDITYLVTNLESFLISDEWLNYFGKRIFMQKPEDMALFPPELGNWYSYLMLFADGNRIDLTLVPEKELDLYLASDKLLKILLDKDGLVEQEIIPTDVNYHITKPTARHFDDCCNEFWWISTYVVKGLCRRELIFAIEHLNENLRKELLRMISWKVGLEQGFSLSLGKNYKYLEKHISSELWSSLIATYSMNGYKEMWHSLFLCQDLFRQISKEVASKLGFIYPNYDQVITDYTSEKYEIYFK